MDSNLLNGQMNLLEMPRIHASNDELMKKFRDFLDNRRMCDCTLVIQEKEYKAHQLILSAKSQLFNKLLKNNNRITIRNITKIVWTQLLHYMYGQPIEISSQKNANELKEGILTLEIDSLFDVGAKLDDAVAKKISVEGWIIENDRIRDLREERKAKMPIIEKKVEKTPAKPAAPKPAVQTPAAKVDKPAKKPEVQPPVKKRQISLDNTNMFDLSSKKPKKTDFRIPKKNRPQDAKKGEVLEKVIKDLKKTPKAAENSQKADRTPAKT